ncbi:MAG: hypothetical protein ACFN3E_02605, partial [Parascardovia denticolens]
MFWAYPILPSGQGSQARGVFNREATDIGAARGDEDKEATRATHGRARGHHRHPRRQAQTGWEKVRAPETDPAWGLGTEPGAQGG